MRKTYLDNLRWIIVVLVVIYHIIYMFNGIETYGIIGPFKEVQYQDMYQYIVYPWFMLLLFVISGMSARYSLEKIDEKKFIKSRTAKYLVPSTLGLLVFWWIMGYFNMLISNAFVTMAAVPKPFMYLIMALSGTGPLWYIQLLWVYSVLLIWIRKIEKGRLLKLGEKTPVWMIVAFVILIFGAAQILNTPIVTVYRFGIYGAGFFLGYFVFSHDLVMDRMEKCWYVLVIMAVISGVVFVFMYWGKPYAEAVVLKTIMCNVYAWFGSIGLLAFMKKFGNFENAFAKFMIKKSWGLYLFHYLGLAVPAYYLHVYAPNLPAVLHYLISGVSAFVSAFLLYEIVSRIPVVRYFAVGTGHSSRGASQCLEECPSVSVKEDE